MKAEHECDTCGQACYCDGEDHNQPQPDDCEHLVNGCGDEDDYEGEE